MQESHLGVAPGERGMRRGIVHAGPGVVQVREGGCRQLARSSAPTLLGPSGGREWRSMAL
jgi:hypothetical protein